MKVALIVIVAIVGLAVAAMLVFVYVIQNVELPDYKRITADGDFEIRDYPPLVVAEVIREGSRQQGLSDGFGPLARYIFAKERGGERIAMTAPVQQQAVAPEKIAMTAPVTQTSAGDDAWVVQFIMPSAYRIEDLPAPAGDDVRLREVPARRVAAVRFSGRTDDQLIAEQEERLRNWMLGRHLEPAGAAVYAYYNDPFTPGFLRRNEIIIPITAGPSTLW
ncbi:MAG: heme-binding protein [Chromatiaceae bacterium]|jgi:hypothetical protein